MALDVSRNRRLIALLAAPLLLAFVACGGADEESTPIVAVVAGTSVATSDIEDGTSADAFGERIAAIEDAVTTWRSAASFEEAHAAAEAAANLVVGPGGPNYGDRDGDGVVGGAAELGVLPGLDGSPVGVANALDGNACIVADVLGGAWDDPTGRWNSMLAAIDEWRPDRNTMPSLPSHPMRIVGWASFTLATDSLDEAHEYAGHAQLHVDISRTALAC